MPTQLSNAVDEYCDEDFDLPTPPRPLNEPKDFFFDSDSDERTADSQPMSRPPLRSRPAIDFSGQHSTVLTNPSFPAPPRPPSHMSGSTLRSRLNPLYYHKTIPSGHSDSFPTLSPEIIASLTVDELYHNPHYRKLQQKYEHLSGLLTKYAERDLAESCAATGIPSLPLTPDIYQGAYFFSFWPYFH